MPVVTDVPSKTIIDSRVTRKDTSSHFFAVDSKLNPAIKKWQENQELEFFKRSEHENNPECYFYKPASGKVRKVAVIVDDIVCNPSLQGFTERFRDQLLSEEIAVYILKPFFTKRNGNSDHNQIANGIIDDPNSFYFFYDQTFRDLSKLARRVRLRHLTKPILLYGYNAGALVQMAFAYSKFSNYRFLNNFRNIESRLFFVGAREYKDSFLHEVGGDRDHPVYSAQHIRDSLVNNIDTLIDNCGSYFDNYARKRRLAIFKQLFLNADEVAGLQKISGHACVFMGEDIDFQQIEWLSKVILKRIDSLDIIKSQQLTTQNISTNTNEAPFKSLQLVT